MVRAKKSTFAFIILSLLAFSSLGATVANTPEKRDMAFPFVSKTVVLGVVGAAVLNRTLQSTGAVSL